MAYLNYLAFPLPADRVVYYSSGDNAIFSRLFDTTNNLLTIPIYPGEYTPSIRALGDPTVIEGLEDEVVPDPLTRQGASVEISNGMIVIKAVLNELREDAKNSSSYITMHDGCDVEFEDRLQGYTIRQVWLELPVIPKKPQARSTVGATIDERMYEGYSLEFKFFD